MADIAPVQILGHSWKKRELPDHTWDQSRTNGITPMTFLFLETKNIDTTYSLQELELDKELLFSIFHFLSQTQHLSV